MECQMFESFSWFSGRNWFRLSFNCRSSKHYFVMLRGEHAVQAVYCFDMYMSQAPLISCDLENLVYRDIVTSQRGHWPLLIRTRYVCTFVTAGSGMSGGIRKIKAIRWGAYYYSLVLNAQPCKYDMYKSSLRHIQSGREVTVHPDNTHLRLNINFHCTAQHAVQCKMVGWQQCAR
jgi:hypothetical protein